ncbi:MAG: hypothetical protein COW00_13965 [Bdellovibrio sp. CG12_big_fil_rev_8_21_14_0_65_39_13]|nr:MAG: hypothetical protein COW78_07390 [Bdellovibrio sp. CG22_combo_CG10-13_8_21_14_all_39_27]PIQ58720.1 MAG: hypothetical protein COW00_13965 [Bdellovibrio sp. CG12_big_fil_rev_8_21_14_0_65_39_13]PIR33095.1 MAG: hypothetical protein COV37_18560 [Bdellovibrio sp. CG11_big_fil_rev_8_21_14_0_20_39_38]PJB53045.1 MAG: hypothetical protein CO099_09280 [Bdellovibrio sp. CG_4_9_14_3_um_filter_39_7]
MNQSFKQICLLVLVASATSTFLAHAEGPVSIKKLTSKETAKKVSKGEIEEDTSSPAPTYAAASGAVNLHSIGLGLGQTFLNGKFQDNGEDKITADLLYSYSASNSFDLLADFHYSKHEFRGRYVRLTGLALGIKAKIFNFDAFSPFVVGGLGFYAPMVKRPVGNDLVESKSKIVFGNHIGLGAELRLNRRVTMGVMAQIHNPFDVKQEIGPEVEGSYGKLLIYGMYSF